MHLRYWHLRFHSQYRVLSSNYYVVEYKILTHKKSPKPHLICTFSYSPNTESGKHWVIYSLQNGHTILFWFHIYISTSTVPIIQATKPSMKFFLGDSKSSENILSGAQFLQLFWSLKIWTRPCLVAWTNQTANLIQDPSKMTISRLF